MLRIVGNTYKLYSKTTALPAVTSSRRNVSSLLRQTEISHKNVKQTYQMSKRFGTPIQPIVNGIGIKSRSYSTEAAQDFATDVIDLNNETNTNRLPTNIKLTCVILVFQRTLILEKPR
jgi:hypothetical protein